MIFKPEFIPKIINQTKVQTRRLVKEGEAAEEMCDVNGKNKSIFAVTHHGKIKWQVGKDYAVQPGRGKPGVWFCNSCGEFGTKDCSSDDSWREKGVATCLSGVWKPLRIKITSIRKEKLLDITEEDAKKEGLKRAEGEDAIEERHLFFRVFWKINKDKLPEKIKKKKLSYWFDALNEWNPEVWVIDFEVME